MRYLLAVLTCGRPEYLKPTLESYARFLDPSPTAIYAWDDGLKTPKEAFTAFNGIPLRVEGERELLGRCAGHGKLWQAAESFSAPYVFTIEDDVVLLRPLNLVHLADVLRLESTVQQIALVRCPWGREIEHGGYIPMTPENYERRTTVENGRGAHWMASTVNWASSPALVPTRLIREVEWPTEDCEHNLGPAILEQHPDAVSGHWSWGDPWCAHIGMERVEAAHGY